jgi:hypothetical protein
MTPSFTLPSAPVDTFDFVEVTVDLDEPVGPNPFVDASLFGLFGPEGKGPGGELFRTPVDGFCDDPEGRRYRLRFMPTVPGRHLFSLTFRHGGRRWQQTGSFTAVDAGRRGLLRVDPAHPWHFQWAGTGEPVFLNGTTAYMLLGFRDDATIQGILDRLHRLKVNRLRVALSPARVKDAQAWCENVQPSEEFTFLYGPWVASDIQNLEHPGWDVTRFDLSFWHKVERLLAHARSLDIAVSLVFYVDGMRGGVDPFGRARDDGEGLQEMGAEDEQRYYRYAAARLAAYSNVMWDLTNEYMFFRTPGWVERMGHFLKSCDPYHHPASVHGYDRFAFRTSGWADFALFQSWDENAGHAFMMAQRQAQAATGRPMPQINEEYGYEDHYPRAWGGCRVYPARSADNRRRIAWEITLAGAYQTTGEFAGVLGGWVNGRGGSDDLLRGHAHLVDFATSFPWWTAEPRPDLGTDGTLCLRTPTGTLAAYTAGGDARVKAEPGAYRISPFNPRTGTRGPDRQVDHPGGPLVLASPDPEGDMAFLVSLESNTSPS